ncbi:hypothetical protein H310_00203 [Aphanomyces invadans]|uniref:Uncharacterized protein n=1 Tax=Aphanomyces invadans TaxID=157072 RepID=A0A024UVK4_9STRA|nr:hypothetical protein H310_00203 [Aphanomyces invadans]ETW09693.1 hypothetical protein H310_00203 [Aphanomyces invadans]|eukprot:XP_008861104.1 hypothetical protein H310_00203 [Aphanomyces invadans]
MHKPLVLGSARIGRRLNDAPPTHERGRPTSPKLHKARTPHYHQQREERRDRRVPGRLFDVHVLVQSQQPAHDGRTSEEYCEEVQPGKVQGHFCAEIRFHGIRQVQVRGENGPLKGIPQLKLCKHVV